MKISMSLNKVFLTMLASWKTGIDLMDALNIGCQWEQTNELLLFYGVDM
jgi:hypothetical protein